jgi:hypothetical protein
MIWLASWFARDPPHRSALFVKTDNLGDFVLWLLAANTLRSRCATGANELPVRQRVTIATLRRRAKSWQNSMLTRQQLISASWPVIDQGVVSLGAFLLSIILARQLPPAEYGIFALLFGGLLTLQMVNTTLLFHPLSVRFALADEGKQARLLAATAALVAITYIPLSAVIGATLLFFGCGDLLPSTIAWFVLWQMQEAMRRGLLAGPERIHECRGWP